MNGWCTLSNRDLAHRTDCLRQGVLFRGRAAEHAPRAICSDAWGSETDRIHRVGLNGHLTGVLSPICMHFGVRFAPEEVHAQAQSFVSSARAGLYCIFLPTSPPLPASLLFSSLVVARLQELFEDFNREVQPRFTAQTYDLMRHNCNTYTNEASQFLLGKGIPECQSAAWLQDEIRCFQGSVDGVAWLRRLHIIDAMFVWCSPLSPLQDTNARCFVYIPRLFPLPSPTFVLRTL